LKRTLEAGEHLISRASPAVPKHALYGTLSSLLADNCGDLLQHPAVADWPPAERRLFAKFSFFKAALTSNLIQLTIPGLLNSVVPAFYYLRLIECSMATIVLDVFPSLVLDIACRGSSFVR
jgi:hypothetical protein